MSDRSKVIALKETSGIFGFGLSHNTNLDLLVLVVLAYSGVLIRFFFSENYTSHGANGPASTLIWGYSLTALSLFLMIFLSHYLNNKLDTINKHKPLFEDENGLNFTRLITILKELILTNSFPIILLLLIVIYTITLNYNYLEQINKGKVTDSYPIYDMFSAFFIIIQIGLIVKYLNNQLDMMTFSLTNSNAQLQKETVLLKSLSYIFATVNFLFVFIMHILLSFFTTDG